MDFDKYVCKYKDNSNSNIKYNFNFIKISLCIYYIYMKYPIIKSGLYTLKSDNGHSHTQLITISQVGINVFMSFYNSFIEKDISITGKWFYNEGNNTNILHLTNDYNNKKMYFYIDKCHNIDIVTLKGHYEDNKNCIFFIEK